MSNGVYCSLPHRRRFLAVALAATIGTIFSIAALSTCRFFTVPYSARNTRTPIIGYRGYGLISYEANYYDSSECTSDWGDLDTMHRTATAFGILAIVFGGTSMIISWCIFIFYCIPCNIHFIFILGIVYGCCAIFQVLTMLFFEAGLCKNNNGCAFAGSAGLSIAALIMWMLVSFGCFTIPPFDEDATVLPVIIPFHCPCPDEDSRPKCIGCVFIIAAIPIAFLLWWVAVTTASAGE